MITKVVQGKLRGTHCLPVRNCHRDVEGSILADGAGWQEGLGPNCSLVQETTPGLLVPMPHLPRLHMYSPQSLPCTTFVIIVLAVNDVKNSLIQGTHLFQGG